jgi:hypothetical protein
MLDSPLRGDRETKAHLVPTKSEVPKKRNQSKMPHQREQWVFTKVVETKPPPQGLVKKPPERQRQTTTSQNQTTIGEPMLFQNKKQNSNAPLQQMRARKHMK